MSLLMCARCSVNVRAHQMTGCLCDDCEAAIDGMTQAELDTDWKVHQLSPSLPTPTSAEETR